MHEREGVVAKYKALFIQRVDAYNVQRPRSRAYYRAKHRDDSNKPLTDEVIRAHLQGTRTIATQSIDKEGFTRWTVLDSDEGLQPLTDAYSALQKDGFHSYIEKSRAGGHLWIWWQERIRPDRAREIVGPYAPELEIFPAGDIPDEDGYGLCLRAPLGIHQATQHRYPFIHPSGEPLVHGSVVRGQVYYLYRNVIRNETPMPQPKLREVPRIVENGNLNYDSPIKRWVEEHDVRGVVGSYVPLSRRGTGHCPWGQNHKNGDSHQSFQVFESTGKWWCHTERVGGNSADFLMRMDRLTPAEFVRKHCRT